MKYFTIVLEGFKDKTAQKRLFSQESKGEEVVSVGDDTIIRTDARRRGVGIRGM